jgi:cysteine desulfurase/selenocysteine lyase
MGGAAGFGAAIEYLEKIGMDRIAKWEHELISYALERFQSMSGVTIVGPKSTEMRGATLSFAVDGIHPHDVGQVLDQNGIAVRTGHHCAWPLMKQFGITGTTRASFYIYNTLEDIDTLVEGVLSAQKYFGGGR